MVRLKKLPALRFRVLLIVLLTSVLCFAQTLSKYGVEVIKEPKVHKRMVKQNPSFEMVDLASIEGLHFDIRYATKNNFTGEVIYEKAKAYARKDVAFALQRCNERLKEKGLALKIFDAYRPYQATVKFYELYKDTTYVASPYSGSRHNRGCAVDLTLVDAETGEELPMPTEYDDFTEKAHPNYEDLPAELVKNRQFLLDTMAEFGFTVYPSEWWHFDYRGWEDFPLLDLSFDELEKL